ncbi:MAG: porin [Verrucomicrobiota bacterium]
MKQTPAINLTALSCAVIIALGSKVLAADGETAAPAPKPAPAAAPAATPTLEERLQALEKNMQTLQKENTDLKAQLGYDGKTPLVVTKPGGKEKSMKIGGFIQGQYETGDQPDARYAGIEDRFLLRRARVNIAGTFKEDFDYKLEADFGTNSLSEQTAYRAQLTDAYVNWNKFEFANVKFGQFKTPFGYEQLVSDTKLSTIERSLPNDRITDGRQIGLGIAGDFFKKRLSYSVGVFNGSGVNNSFNDNESYMWAGRVSGVALDSKIADKDARIAVGVNALTSRDKGTSKPGYGIDSVPGGAVDNLFFGQRSSYGLDAQAKWWLFGLEAEYLLSHFEPSNRVPFEDFDAQGWYIMATAEVWPKYLQALVKYKSLIQIATLPTPAAPRSTAARCGPLGSTTSSKATTSSWPSITCWGTPPARATIKAACSHGCNWCFNQGESTSLNRFDTHKPLST